MLGRYPEEETKPSAQAQAAVRRRLGNGGVHRNSGSVSDVGEVIDLAAQYWCQEQQERGARTRTAVCNEVA